MELKKIFQAWNDEVNDSGDGAGSPLKQKSRSESISSEASDKEESIVLPPNGKSLSGSRHAGMEEDFAGTQNPFENAASYGRQESLEVEDRFGLHEDMHSVKRRRSGLSSVSKLFRRADRRRQNRPTHVIDSPKHLNSPANASSVMVSTITSVISDAGHTTFDDYPGAGQTPRLGMQPSDGGEMEVSLMEGDIGYSWSSQPQNARPGSDRPGVSLHFPPPYPGQAGSTPRQQFHTQQADRSNTARNPRRAGRLPPTYVGARWENRTGYYMSDTSPKGN